MLLICNSCLLNRSVRLYPIEPFTYEEDGIIFTAGGNGEYGFWIAFTHPLVNYRSDVYFNIRIRSDYIIENMFLESVSLSVEDLGIIIAKENIHETLKIFSKEDTASWENPPDAESYVLVTINNIYTDEIRDAMSEKLSIKQLYNKFKSVKKVSFALEFTYKINGDEKSKIVIFNYETKCKTSDALFDALMSV
jgi:hypothetical protein